MNSAAGGLHFQASGNPGWYLLFLGPNEGSPRPHRLSRFPSPPDLATPSIIESRAGETLGHPRFVRSCDSIHLEQELSAGSQMDGPSFSYVAHGFCLPI